MKARFDLPTLTIATLGILLFLSFGVGIDYPPSSTARDDLRKLFAGQRVSIRSLHVANLESACGEYRVSHDPLPHRFLTRREGTWVNTPPSDWQLPPRVGKYSTTLDDSWSSCETTTGRGHSLDFVTIPILLLILNLT